MRHRFCEHEACGHPEPPCRRSGTSQPRGRVQRAGQRQPSKVRTRDMRGVDTMTPQVETPELIYRGLVFFRPLRWATRTRRDPSRRVSHLSHGPTTTTTSTSEERQGDSRGRFETSVGSPLSIVQRPGARKRPLPSDLRMPERPQQPQALVEFVIEIHVSASELVHRALVGGGVGHVFELVRHCQSDLHSAPLWWSCARCTSAQSRVAQTIKRP